MNRDCLVITLGVVVSLGLVIGCTGGGTTQEPVSSDPGASTSSPMPIDWGPLAVGAWGTGAEALVAGTLRITETCVYLETPGSGKAIIVWNADRATWLAERRAIDRSPDGETVVLADGDEVAFGGGGDSTAESGIDGDAWIAATTWVARPDHSCPIEARWFVNEYLVP